MALKKNRLGFSVFPSCSGKLENASECVGVWLVQCRYCSSDLKHHTAAICGLFSIHRVNLFHQLFANEEGFGELFVFYPWMRENQTTCYFHTMLFIKTNQRIKEQIMANTPLTIIVRFLFLESRLGKPLKNQNHLAQLNRITIKWSFLLPNTLWSRAH